MDSTRACQTVGRGAAGAALLLLFACATPRSPGTVSVAGCEPPKAGADFAPFAAFVASFNARDAAGFERAFAEDATFFFDLDDPATRVEGRDGIMAVFRPHFAQPMERRSFVLKPVAVRSQPVGGAVLVSFQVEFPQAIMRRSVVFRCDRDAWRIVHLHASSKERAPAGQ
jgi:ketosteroid isomerase-like protein